jgi:hypothetical protein
MKRCKYLNKTEQNAIVLRFLENRSLRETGEALAVSEDAAQKRIGRALDKLRLHFARHRITVSSALVAAALVTASAQTAPVGLAAGIARGAIAATTGGVGLTTLKLLMAWKAKIALTIGAAVAAAALGLFLFRERATTPSAIFRGLGDLRGGAFASYASGVSVDGTVVVGGVSRWHRDCRLWHQSRRQHESVGS